MTVEVVAPVEFQSASFLSLLTPCPCAWNINMYGKGAVIEWIEPAPRDDY